MCDRRVWLTFVLLVPLCTVLLAADPPFNDPVPLGKTLFFDTNLSDPPVSPVRVPCARNRFHRTELAIQRGRRRLPGGHAWAIRKSQTAHGSLRGRESDSAPGQ